MSRWFAVTILAPVPAELAGLAGHSLGSQGVIGTTLNHYRITEILGSGGMGEVYAADDTKLKRRVAIKVLPQTLSGEPERRQRFEREAHAIAALNHPNIVTVYSIEQSGEHLFITMELVRGKVLSELIPPHGLPIDKMLAFAIPLADGVSAAHQEGVIHRDLKPTNVMVADDGRVKVLDFGIARLTDVSTGERVGKALTTELATGAQVIVGTVAYMSPEQAEGRAVDARSDVFSLGVVLYELATGEQPFRGATPVSILSSIIKEQAPAITTSNPALPSELARIVRRCLAKDPARRYQTAADVRNDLLDLEQELRSGRSALPQLPRAALGWHWREWAAWTATAALAVLAVLAWHGREDPVAPPAVDLLSVLAPDDVILTEGEAPVLSPDGRSLAFVATDASGKTRLYLRERGSPDPRVLEETDDATQPFWSPDGRSLGFFAAGQLKRVDLAGGRPRSLAAAPVPRGASWSRDGRILFVGFPEDPPQVVAAAGGPVRSLAVRQEGDWRWFPSWLPNGDYLFQGLGLAAAGPYGVVRGSLESAEVVAVVAATRGPPPFLMAYVEPGYLIYRREGAVVAQRFDPVVLELRGDAVTLIDDVGFNPVHGQTLASVSSAGALAYLGPGRGWQLAAFDRAGQRLASVATIGDYNSLCLSAGDRALVYDDSSNLQLLDLATGASTPLTFDGGFYTACSATRDEAIFAGTRGGSPNLFRLALAAPGGEQRLLSSQVPSLPSHWSRDGRLVLFSAYSRETSWDIWVFPLEGGEPFAFLATAAEEKSAQLSPDGRWMAYTSNQSGVDEVYVQPFPAAGGRWQISRGGGRQAQWRGDGAELYYVSPDKKLMAVDVTASAATFTHGLPRALLETVRGAEVERTHIGAPYAVTADGQRFLAADAVDTTRPIMLMLNWPSLLEGAQDRNR